MTDLADVLRRATDDLAPESPDLLLARAVRRGSDLRRRRRVTAAAVGVGTAAAACAVVGLVVGRPFDQVDAARISHPGPAPSRTIVESPDEGAQVAVARDRLGATFARIVPGTISDEHDVPPSRVPSPGAHQSTFDWNGYLVSLIITPYDGEARARCLHVTDDRGSGQACVRVPGGWSVHDDQMTATDLNRWVSVYRDNGFQMWVLIYNSGSEKGSTSGGQPPLGVPALERVATSDLWFS